MTRQRSPHDDLFQSSRKLVHDTRTGVMAIRQLVARSEATAAASWALLRKAERLEAAYFDRTLERGH